MKKYLVVLFIFTLAILASAQEKKSDATALELAKATLKAHGGEKLAQIKSLILRGGVEVSAPGSTQTLPAQFAIVVSGEKYRLDIQSMMFNFRQMSDGQQTYSSMAGVSLPPMTRVGLQVLPYIENTGFVVSPLPEKFKKKLGFRITAPEGYYTDFLVDDKTKLVKEFESSYELSDKLVTTSVSIDKYKEVEGVLINEKFSQRLDMGQFTSYANFNAKEILVNTAVADDVFTMSE